MSSWKDMHPVISQAVFEDGTVIELPSIEVGEAGHVYRPPGFPDPTNPKRTTFGRGSGAQDRARRIVGDGYLHQLRQASRNSKLIRVSSNYRWETSGGMGATYFGPMFGVFMKDTELGAWVTLTAWRDTYYGYRRNETPVHYRVSYPWWGLPLSYMDGIDLYNTAQPFVHTTVIVPCSSVTAANNALLRFKEDPFGVITDVHAEYLDRQEQEDPIERFKLSGQSVVDTVRFLKSREVVKAAKKQSPDWIQHTTPKKFEEDGHLVLFVYDRDAEYLTREALGTVLQKQLEPLGELGKAIAVTGAKFKLDYETAWPREDSALKALHIETPARPKVKGQEHSHNILIDDRGIHVECGYLQDEQKALEYEKRKIRQALLGEEDQPIEETEWETTTYEIGA